MIHCAPVCVCESLVNCELPCLAKSYYQGPSPPGRCPHLLQPSLLSDIPELQEQSGLTPHRLCPFFWHLSTCDAQHWRRDRGSGDSGPSREAQYRQTSLGAARGARAEAAVKDSDTVLQSVGS